MVSHILHNILFRQTSADGLQTNTLWSVIHRRFMMGSKRSRRSSCSFVCLQFYLAPEALSALGAKWSRRSSFGFSFNGVGQTFAIKSSNISWIQQMFSRFLFCQTSTQSTVSTSQPTPILNVGWKGVRDHLNTLTSKISAGTAELLSLQLLMISNYHHQVYYSEKVTTH